MEENKNNIDAEEIKVERHEWPDEIIEKKKKRRGIFVTILVLIVAFFILGFTSAQVISPLRLTGDDSKFNEIENILTKYWYFGKDVENLETLIPDNGFYGMSDVSFIDPHTTYLSAEEIQKYTENLSGTYVGIGVQYYESEDGVLLIDRVFNDSPAELGGIKAGDIMYSVDGVLVEGLTTDEVSSMVRGKSDTEVKMVVLRDNKQVEIIMIRKEVIHSSFGEQLNAETAYIELEQFGETTAKEVANYLAKFKDSKQLIIDLRNNGGGYLKSVIDIASLFLDKDEVVLITEDKAGNKSYEKTIATDTYTFDDIVILVNGGTASASEVLTAALKSHLDNITVVGVNTYGKGTVQQTQMLSDNSAIKFTTAEWFAPDGGKIHGVGIKPDHVVELHKIIAYGFAPYAEGQTYKLDEIGQAVETVQNALDFLGYKVDRRDGYFDQSTDTALRVYQADLNLEVNGIIDGDLYSAITSRTIRQYNENKDKYDLQKNFVLEKLGVK